MPPHRRSSGLAAFSCLLIASCTSTGGTGPSPGRNAPPATFVLAWTGPGGEVLTMESSDGALWRRRAVHDTTSARDFGPSLAHDGRLNWMLMWANGPELQYKVGIGGSSVAAGITWEAAPNTGVLPVQPGSSPALAYANDRWLAVWRSTAGTLRAVRSARGSASSWDTAVAVLHGAAQAQAPALRAPALTSATINGQRVYVLVYNHQTQGAVAATTADGLVWSNPVSIAATQKDPAIAEWNGNLYVALSRQVGAGYRNFVYKSANAVSWREIASHLQAPINAAGPGLAVAPWKLLLTEQIGGAAGGGALFTGISNRAGRPGSPSANPVSYSFTGDRPVVVAGGSTPETVGRLLARTALLYAEPSGQAIALTDVAVTQSGIVDTLPPRELVSGKTTLVRTTLRARPRSAGQPGQVDSARLDVIDLSSGQTVVSVPGFAYAADNVTLLPAIPDSADAHFFVPGSSLAGDADVRLDLTLASGNTRRVITGVVDALGYRRNKGIPLILTGFDMAPPTSAVVAGELMQLGRIFPVADGVGSLGSAAAGSSGVRFQYVSGIALPAQGSLGSYVDEFVLINVPAGATGPSGIPCATDAIPTPFPGRVFTINFTGPEDLDRNGVFSAAEVANCTGSPAPINIRFGNFLARLGSETLARWGAASASDPPEFGAAVMTFGGPANAAAQNRSGLAGQCPQGLSSSRLCWASVGLNAPVLQHELGHAVGLCHVDDANCVTAAPPFPAGRFGYDLLNRIRVTLPQRIMTGNVPGGLGSSFLTPAEYEQARTALLSPQYLAANAGNGPGTRVASPAVFLAPPDDAAHELRMAARQTNAPSVVLVGSATPAGVVRIISARATAMPMPSPDAGDDLVARQLDRAGRELSRLGFALPEPSAEHGAPPRATPFVAAIPLVDATHTLVLEQRGREIHRVTASANAPTVRLEPGALSAAGDSVVIRWSARDADGDDLTFDVALVYGAGQRVELLASAARGARLALPAERVPGGENVELRVQASDGLHIAAAAATGISVPDRAPTVMLAYPPEGATFAAGGRVLLRALAMDPEDGMLPGSRLRWSSDTQGALGEGAELQAALSTGPHRIRVIAEDSNGARAEASVRIVVRP